MKVSDGEGAAPQTTDQEKQVSSSSSSDETQPAVDAPQAGSIGEATGVNSGVATPPTYSRDGEPAADADSLKSEAKTKNAKGKGGSARAPKQLKVQFSSV